MEKNLTSGSVLKNIIYFSLPYLLSYFLQTLYGMADLFTLVSLRGSQSTTAVSIGSQVMHMITVMIVGPCHGFYGYHCTGNRCQGQKKCFQDDWKHGCFVYGCWLLG